MRELRMDACHADAHAGTHAAALDEHHGRRQRILYGGLEWRLDWMKGLVRSRLSARRAFGARSNLPLMRSSRLTDCSTCKLAAFEERAREAADAVMPHGREPTDADEPVCELSPVKLKV
jgi:hypothetical protein